MALAILWAPLV